MPIDADEETPPYYWDAIQRRHDDHISKLIPFSTQYTNRNIYDLQVAYARPIQIHRLLARAYINEDAKFSGAKDLFYYAFVHTYWYGRMDRTSAR